MSAVHTPGRVFLTDTGRIGAGDPQRHDRLKIHSPWIEDAWDGDAEADANMRRIAACWNACEGVPTEVLESQQAGGLPWSVADQIDARMERDRLTALCAEWERKTANWMASPEAAQRLQGYRDLAGQAADALNQRDRLLAALREIEHATAPTHDDGAYHENAHELARAAIHKATGGAA